MQFRTIRTSEFHRIGGGKRMSARLATARIERDEVLETAIGRKLRSFRSFSESIDKKSYVIVEGDDKQGLFSLLSGELTLPLEYNRAQHVPETSYIIFSKLSESSHESGVYSTRKARFVIPVEYSGVLHLGGSHFAVANGAMKWGVFSAEDERLNVPTAHSEVYCLENLTGDGLLHFGVIIDGMFGAYSSSGEMVVPIRYEGISYLGENLFRVYRGGGYCGVYSKNTNSYPVPIQFFGVDHLNGRNFRVDKGRGQIDVFEAESNLIG
jgi:hypothetical protein